MHPKTIPSHEPWHEPDMEMAKTAALVVRQPESKFVGNAVSEALQCALQTGVLNFEHWTLKP